MFVRFRKSLRRLDVSLAETRRVGGKVRQEHIASLGSIALPPTVASRMAFWARIHQHIAQLSNRVDCNKILGALFARIPMPTAEEQRALQLENAKADAQFCGMLGDMCAERIEGHKALVAAANKQIADDEAEKAKAANDAATARERLAKIERGEDVKGGFGKAMTYKDLERLFGKAFLKRAAKLDEPCAMAPTGFDELLAETARRRERAEKSALTAVRKRHGLR
jgi:hypothetical protein